MNICVIGYYFNVELYDILYSRVFKNYIHVVCHKTPPRIYKNTKHLEFIKIDNIGLEFHAYDFYLKSLWNGSDTLFMHDDVIIEDENVFDKIAESKVDCGYIFRDKYEDMANGGKHGRAIFMSKAFLEFVKGFTCECEWCIGKEDKHNKGTILPKLSAHTGFWYDKFNRGHISGKPPIGVRHYNSAIDHFHWFIGRVRDQRCGIKESWPNPKVKMNVVNRLYFSDFIPGRRNCWRHVEKEIVSYRRRELNETTSVNNNSSAR